MTDPDVRAALETLLGMQLLNQAVTKDLFLVVLASSPLVSGSTMMEYKHTLEARFKEAESAVATVKRMLTEAHEREQLNLRNKLEPPPAKPSGGMN